MQQQISVEEIRAGLTARLEQLRLEKREVENALRELDSAVAAYQRFAPRSEQPPRELEPEKSSEPDEGVKEGERRITQRVLEMILRQAELERRERFDPAGLTPEVNAESGPPLNQGQVSIAMRNLEKSGKLVTIQKGGPRKPAVYALPGSKAAQEALLLEPRSEEGADVSEDVVQERSEVV